MVAGTRCGLASNGTDAAPETLTKARPHSLLSGAAYQGLVAGSTRRSDLDLLEQVKVVAGARNGLFDAYDLLGNNGGNPPGSGPCRTP